MSYQVFARKFRPQDFESVVGQEHVTTTLKNAIKKSRIAQSFLFSGSHGIGKTSTARILAKALNCKEGPTDEPCGKCYSCDEITRGASLDVLEIDGASNRGIDEIRTLRENVKFKPATGRYKIYIIDEVHMLTGEAFNALLKTLEEPPEHVKFIFATTEPHKVPLTILSRCQRFHFKRLSSADIHAKLGEIAKKEKIKIPDKALFLIAKSADGSLRDGEGLLDQLASFSEGDVQEKDVIFSLGLTSGETYSEFLNAIQLRDSVQILALVQALVEQGKDLEQFLKGLLERFRDLLVLVTCKQDESKWVEQDEETLAELKVLAKKFTRDELFLILSLIQQALREIKWSKAPRFLLEICLLKLANRADLKSLDEILAEIKKVGAGVKPAPTSAFSPAREIPVSDKKKADSPAAPSPLKFAQVLSRQPQTPKAQLEEINTNASSETQAIAVAEQDVSDGPLTLDDVEQVWAELLEQTKAKRMSIGMFLSESEPVEVAGNLVVFGFPTEFKFHKETIEQQTNKAFVRDILRGIMKRPVDVTFVVTEAERTEKLVPQSSAQPSPADANVIMSALEIFEGSKVIRKT